MTSETRYSEYNAFAQIYNKEIGNSHSDYALRALDKLLFPYLTKGADILDLCCGTGQLVKQLMIKGYQVTGLDGSEDMLRYARKNLPDGKFILDDARFFKLPSTFDAIISTSASLNHVTNIEELQCIFQNVHTALVTNSIFLFDLNLEERFDTDTEWKGSLSGNVTEEYAWAWRKKYDPQDKIGKIDITVFEQLNATWQRSDMTWLVKSYSKTEIQSALKNVGFTEISVYDAERDFAIHGKAGNAYFVCRKG